MTHPVVDFSTEPIRQSDADALLLAIPAISDIPEESWAAWGDLKQNLDRIGFTGAPSSFARVYAPEIGDKPIAVVGLGTEPRAGEVRAAIGVGCRTLTGFGSVAIASPFTDIDLAAAAEGAGLGATTHVTFKSGSTPARAQRVIVHSATAPGTVALDRVRATVAAVAMVKELVTTPAALLGPDDLAQRALAELADLPVDVRIWDEVELAADGCGGILGVGQGSPRPPRLVRLDYSPVGAKTHVAIVGKGITFDSGGLSLKPAGGMVDMKYDMCGAATVLAVVRAVAAMEAPVHLTGWLCIAENMPSGSATRPGDVLTMADGTTVEVLNTDAEGRLVLADGLVLASREHPDLLVDVATLTGAITVALGTRHVGVMGDDDAVSRYLAAAASADEFAWQLPLPRHMVEELDSPVADMRNAKVGDPAGGSLFAGLFLQRFVGPAAPVDEAAQSDRIPWVHLDIAGVGMNKGAGYGFTDKGPTAATVRSLIELALREADA
ncbi:leucyl aminopeptidase [Microbacterium sediminicola]|uniref:Probable cytosol aminopeptidase n=1 Tax=Microbacterium sediminicola TaxID=415210 RepID=A0ABN2HTJ6_9MICO